MIGTGPSAAGGPLFLRNSTMEATGITAEFDPLHNGHAYLIEEARSLTGCDAVVVAMSGDYVQRGEPALTDKWSRTEAALASGADLVIEIPVLFCLGNASQYAKASVRLLEAAGCTHIAFGSESGETELIEKTAGNINRMARCLEAEISSLSKEGLSYPAARAEAYATLRKEEVSAGEVAKELSVLREPNDILALEYILSMKTSRPLAIKRRGAPHSCGGLKTGEYQSASAIRKLLHDRRVKGADLFEGLSDWIPEASLEILNRPLLTFTDDWTAVLRYAVMSSDPAFIEDCPSGGEGLGWLLKKAVHDGQSFGEIISSVKSKRYTYTRISRLCMQTVLGITRTKYPYDMPYYARVLGFSSKGRELLSVSAKDVSCSLPFITNINKEWRRLGDDARNMLGLDVHASDIYNLVTGRSNASDSDHVRTPVMKDAAEQMIQKEL